MKPPVVIKIMTVEEHPFARFIKILGKGRNGMRSLTRQEAYEAMSLFARYEVEPEQLGAFMSLLRVKEETPDELAGFAMALRESMVKPAGNAEVCIDWPAYAGKRRQLPWFVLAAVLLGRNGYPVFMHGLSRDDERLYAEEALKALEICDSKSLSEAVAYIKQGGFAYMKIGNLSPVTAELMETRTLLGLRSPINTVVRMLNPLSAPLMMQGVFHPNYAQVHQQAGLILEQPALIAFRGEGGEAERAPDRNCNLAGISNGEAWEESWPAMLPPGKYSQETSMDLAHFKSVWLGSSEDKYGELAVTGTVAIVLRTLGICANEEDATARAMQMWNARHTTALKGPVACQGI